MKLKNSTKIVEYIRDFSSILPDIRASLKHDPFNDIYIDTSYILDSLDYIFYEEINILFSYHRLDVNSLKEPYRTFFIKEMPQRLEPNLFFRIRKDVFYQNTTGTSYKIVTKTGYECLDFIENFCLDDLK